MDSNNRKILVTGATGLVGSHVMLHLLEKGYEVCGLYRPSSDIDAVRQVFRHYGKEPLFRDIEWRCADMLDVQTISEAMVGISVVYHTAAMVSFSSSDHSAMWRANVEGTANVVAAAIERGVEAMCHVSSIGALGHTSDGSVIDESTPFQPDADRSVYSQSKFRQEMEVWRGMEQGLKAVIVNPGVVLGPCLPSRSSGSIASATMDGSRFYVEGQTGYVDVRDVAKAMVMLVEQDCFGERYILVSENSTVRNVQDMFSDEFGVDRPTLKASKLLMNIAATALAIKSFFTGAKPALTYESVRSMGGSNTYSSDKIKNKLSIEFIPLKDSVANMAAYHSKIYETELEKQD